MVFDLRKFDARLSPSCKIWVLVTTKDSDEKVEEVRESAIKAEFVNISIAKELKPGIARESFDHVIIVFDGTVDLTPFLGAAFESLRPSGKISIGYTDENLVNTIKTNVLLAGFIDIKLPGGKILVAKKVDFSSIETVPLKIPNGASTSNDEIIDERALLAEEDFKKPENANGKSTINF